MADIPVAELGGKTPLQVARTPGMDRIAAEGVSGTLLTLPPGYPTSSEVANMSVLGCDLATEYCGRGPLEALGRGIPLGRDDVAFRVNLTTVADGVLRDFSGGHIEHAAARELVATLDRELGSERVAFHSGVSYRNLLVLSGGTFSAAIAADKPDDNHGEKVADHLPRAKDPAAHATAQLLCDLTARAPAVLEAAPYNRQRRGDGQPMANGIWIWSGGKAGAMRSLRDKYGITGAVISAVDVIVGLGRALGLDSIRVPGATGYTDTNYEGKAAAALEALKTRDFVFLHLEAIDEVSHEQNLQEKIRAIEAFDARIISPVLAALPPEAAVAVLPDHPVPIATGKHTREPVPVSVRLPGRTPDGVRTFDEIACASGSLGRMANGDLMQLLFG